MTEQEAIEFWDKSSLVHLDEEIMHREPVLKGTRLPADTIVGNIEGFMELRGLSEPQAVAATINCFPHTPGGADAIRKLLAYQEAHLRQPVPWKTNRRPRRDCRAG